ncbi:hypothetical protein HC028_01185 [Planosporangium flavigriseum]|uniref:Uncharacterized protein n=1 Tax=Planosporangium flavigriseum TaxID=373681 RepID=A0A8J3LPK1_9ACTN|nr:hypothetical protein [Planosporangium flavigriseum]NJC63133.1 hypothetical protein [Planosporangium flavigriseum]GIG74510.1 hypothetical protein Pfl04_29140 [Planosporangium flavigriseum]
MAYVKGKLVDSLVGVYAAGLLCAYAYLHLQHRAVPDWAWVTGLVAANVGGWMSDRVLDRTAGAQYPRCATKKRIRLAGVDDTVAEELAERNPGVVFGY